MLTLPVEMHGEIAARLDPVACVCMRRVRAELCPLYKKPKTELPPSWAQSYAAEVKDRVLASVKCLQHCVTALMRAGLHQTWPLLECSKIIMYRFQCSIQWSIGTYAVTFRRDDSERILQVSEISGVRMKYETFTDATVAVGKHLGDVALALSRIYCGDNLALEVLKIEGEREEARKREREAAMQAAIATFETARNEARLQRLAREQT